MLRAKIEFLSNLRNMKRFNRVSNIYICWNRRNNFKFPCCLSHDFLYTPYLKTSKS
uniref:Uncharacterized protein n=1 Tax=Solanum lycopersicum TaxID=4081 RepID=A0A3Q7ER52_SOLLC